MKYYFLSVAAAFALVFCARGQTNNQPADISSHTMLPGTAPAADGGRRLFLKNCAHCHGADARGDDGPDLHALDWTDEQIAKRIRTGKKGQMTAFEGKLTEAEIKVITAYVRTLK